MLLLEYVSFLCAQCTLAVNHMPLTTEHSVIIGDAGRTKALPAESVHLMVTSPPYPMIAMWDDLFCNRSARVADKLKKGKGGEAFELMHQDLEPVWDQVYRVLKPGGFACINMGDATNYRTPRRYEVGFRFEF